MHAPEYICKEIERIHKRARLAWFGQDRKSDEEPLNKGTFILIQLMHWRDAENSPMQSRWEGRFGPIFGSRYDLLMRVPMMVCKVSPEEVFSGKVLARLKYTMKPIRERLYEENLKKGQEYERTVTEQAEATADHMLWHNSKNWQNSSSIRTLTKEDVTEEDKAVLRGERKKDLTKTFLPPEGSYV
jgi:hypothetical protein